MAEISTGTPGASSLATENAQPGFSLSAGEPAISNDSKLAAILQKQASGEKLSASERGYLGSVRRKATPKTAGTPVNPNPLLAVPENPENPLFEAEAAAPAPAQATMAAIANPELLHRTADSILSSLDKATQLYIGWEAKEAGADSVTREQYKKAVALQPENRQLIVENSDPFVLALCEKFGCTPEKLESVIKGSGFVGGLVAHGLGVYTAVRQLRELRKERPAPAPEQK